MGRLSTHKNPLRRSSLSQRCDPRSATSLSSASVSAVTSVDRTANVRVVVRVRPENCRELAANHTNVVRPIDESMLVFDPRRDEQQEYYQGRPVTGRNLLKKPHKDTRYVFDRVFHPHHSNRHVFDATMPELVNSLMDGFNCSVFAYGSTGAGKTFTMLGTPETPGIVFLTVLELYERIEKLQGKKCKIIVSYLEVYNESVSDLLSPSGRQLDVRDDGQRLVTIKGLTQHEPSGPEHLMSLLNDGNRNRTQHPTDMNAESSRSHAVFQVLLRQRDVDVGLSGDERVSKLSLIDLAGSERGSATGNKGARFREGANINKSLLALGSCINALADGKKFVPYRGSKLTRLLKDSIGGNCRTLMIAAVTPSAASYEDTHNTLRYADRAKAIKSKLQRNVVSVDFHVSQYARIVDELKQEVAVLKTRLADAEARADAASDTPAVCPSCSCSVTVAAGGVDARQPAAVMSSAATDVSGNGAPSTPRHRRRRVMAAEAERRACLERTLRLEAECQQVRLRVHRRRVARQRCAAAGGCGSSSSLPPPPAADALETRLLHQLAASDRQLGDSRQQLAAAHSQLREEYGAAGVAEAAAAETGDASWLALEKESELVEYRVVAAHLDTVCRVQHHEMSRLDQLCQLTVPAFHEQYLLLQHLKFVTPQLEKQHKEISALVEGSKEVCWADLCSPVRDSPGQGSYGVLSLLRLSSAQHVPSQPCLAVFGRSGVLRHAFKSTAVTAASSSSSSAAVTTAPAITMSTSKRLLAVSSAVRRRHHVHEHTAIVQPLPCSPLCETSDQAATTRTAQSLKSPPPPPSSSSSCNVLSEADVSADLSLMASPALLSSAPASAVATDEVVQPRPASERLEDNSSDAVCSSVAVDGNDCQRLASSVDCDAVSTLQQSPAPLPCQSTQNDVSERTVLSSEREQLQTASYDGLCGGVTSSCPMPLDSGEIASTGDHDMNDDTVLNFTVPRDGETSIPHGDASEVTPVLNRTVSLGTRTDECVVEPLLTTAHTNDSILPDSALTHRSPCVSPIQHAANPAVARTGVASTDLNVTRSLSPAVSLAGSSCVKTLMADTHQKQQQQQRRTPLRIVSPSPHRNRLDETFALLSVAAVASPSDGRHDASSLFRRPAAALLVPAGTTHGAPGQSSAVGVDGTTAGVGGNGGCLQRVNGSARLTVATTCSGTKPARNSKYKSRNTPTRHLTSSCSSSRLLTAVGNGCDGVTSTAGKNKENGSPRKVANTLATRPAWGRGHTGSALKSSVSKTSLSRHRK